MSMVLRTSQQMYHTTANDQEATVSSCNADASQVTEDF